MLKNWGNIAALKEDFWPNIKDPVTILHGSHDGLIYPENADFIRDQIDPEYLFRFRIFGKRGHDLFWSERKNVKKEILDMIYSRNQQMIVERPE